MKPKPKIIDPKMDSKPKIVIRNRQHKRLILGAIRAEADITIMHVKIRGKWERLAQDLEKHHIKILTPEEYVADRKG